MDHYEYRSITLQSGHLSDDPLNELAREGWRAVSSTRLDDDRIWVLLERLVSEAQSR